QEEDEDPQGNRSETVPRERRHQMPEEVCWRIALQQEVDKALEQASDEYDNPVECRLEQDWLDKRCPIVVPQEWHLVGDEYGLADNQRTHRGEHEVADRDQVLSNEQICRKHDQVETDKEEDRGRQRLASFMQEQSPDTADDTGGSTGNVIVQLGPCP